MKCIKCGSDLGENDVFCANCGEPVQKANVDGDEAKDQNMYAYERPVNQQTNYNGGQGPVQQTNYNQQQATNQQNYGQQPYKNNNTGNIVKICLIVLIAIIVVVASIFIILYITRDDKKNGDNNSQISSDSTNTSSIADNYNYNYNDNDNDNSETVTSVSNKKSSSYKVKFKGFNLYIPDNLIYEVDNTNNVMMIGDEEATWVAGLYIVEGSFQKLKQNKNYINSSLTQEGETYGVTVSNVTVETINGVEYILVECSASGTNMIIGYASLNSMYCIMFELYNENNDFDRDMVNDISDIVNNAEYTGDSSYIKSNDNVKFTEEFNKVFEIKEEE